MKKICFIRPPYVSSYNDNDVREETIITSFLGYLDSISYEGATQIFDFHLDPSVSVQKILEYHSDVYIIAVRDVGDSYHYAMRIAASILNYTNAKVYFYGQVSPLRHYPELNSRVTIVNHSERQLAESLGLDTEGAHFESDLQYCSYFHSLNLDDWQNREKRGCIETTRGCEHKCSFCFINLGSNFEKKWQIRSGYAIVSDIKKYLDQGISKFVFLDSEFLGVRKVDHIEKTKLLNMIKDELPPIRYSIWNRADTLLKFNQFDLLKQSGLTKVLIGVESFFQEDLDILNKATKSEWIEEAIIQLINRHIYCCLTFMTFNRNTTVESLRCNLSTLERLHHQPNAKYLGVPHFTFNIEIARHNSDLDNQLSEKTYLRQLTMYRGQVDKNHVVFSKEFEPLAEICRLLHYEWTMKKCRLNRSVKDSDSKTKYMVDNWFERLSLFCIEQLQKFLAWHEEGSLNYENLAQARDELYRSLHNYHREFLPFNLSELETFENHASLIDYKGTLERESHGWDEKIPLLSSNFTDVFV
ncbi:MAG: radical SAM protein [Symploca sp. SIO1C4]|uniref:Radical SAM protein n=1 Tax=Symploca sp. SIO1C4 TaxID=2607765 RepID=A0A6B3NG25_9CYAN|nr:radical SAM protein [Symploca sp. SIO1C4]